MDKIKIIGGNPLYGKIAISGSKNATLPLMAASLLTPDTLVLSNIPKLADIITMSNLLSTLGAKLTIDGNYKSHNGKIILINASNINSNVAPYEIVKKMRASIWVLGPLLARFGEAFVSLPGGCAIGSRPIDMHLKAFEEMGATINLKDGYIHAFTNGRLKGAEIIFDKISVGATINAMLAATLAKGTTTLINIAKEPEITDVANCLNLMGADIREEANALIINGVESLHGTTYKVMPDRIEAGTYAIAAAMTGGEVELTDINHSIIDNLILKLIEAGISITTHDNSIVIKRDPSSPIKSVNIDTRPYPGFATDLQAQFMSLMTIASGTSIICENIFENRFMHVPELARMGADITLKGNNAIVLGVPKLQGANVMATDLRASVSLVIAGLVANGVTLVDRVYHIDRGYDGIEEKLAACGAQIERVRAVL